MCPFFALSLLQDSCEMPPEHGMPNGTADAVVNRRPRRLFGRASERKNPLNLQFVCHHLLLLSLFSSLFPWDTTMCNASLPTIFIGASSSSPWIKTATIEVHRCSFSNSTCLSMHVQFMPQVHVLLLSDFISFFYLSFPLNLWLASLHTETYLCNKACKLCMSCCP